MAKNFLNRRMLVVCLGGLVVSGLEFLLGSFKPIPQFHLYLMLFVPFLAVIVFTSLVESKNEIYGFLVYLLGFLMTFLGKLIQGVIFWNINTPDEKFSALYAKVHSNSMMIMEPQRIPFEVQSEVSKSPLRVSDLIGEYLEPLFLIKAVIAMLITGLVAGLISRLIRKILIRN